MLSFLKKCKKIILISLLLIIVGAGIFGFVGSRANIKTARAVDPPAKTDTKTEEINATNWFKDPGNTTLWLIGVVVSLIVRFLGGVLSVLLMVLFMVARYNNFINSPAVVTGWVVIRDLCNIFFIVIFLVMVVSTVLDIEEYSYSRILKKLLIMAVLINFSKLICGIFIDAAQVVMMAFMSSIGQLGAKYFVYMLGIDQIMAAKSNIRGWTVAFPENWSSIVMSYVLAVIYMIVTIATVLVLLVVLIQRVVMLWIYVVLSPAAYFLSTFPQGASYSGKWWSEFVKYVTIGPIVAFFLWLSFVSMGNTENQAKILKDMSKETIEETAYLEKDAISPQVGITEGGSPSHIVKFIIGIALLLGGLMAAQTIGGMAGNFAGSTIKNLQSGGMGAIKTGADWLNRKQARLTGQDLHFGRRWALIKAGMETNKATDLSKISQRADQLMKGRFGAIAGTGSADWYNQCVQGILGWKGVRKGIKNIFVPPKSYDDKARGASDKIKTLMQQQDNVYTRDELKTKEADDASKEKDLEKKLKDYESDVKDPLTDLNSTIVDLKKAIENPKLRGGRSVDDIEKDLAKAEKDKEKLESGIAKRQDDLETHRGGIAQFKDDRSKGIIRVVGTAAEKDKRKEEIENDIKKQRDEYLKYSKKFARYTVLSPEAKRARRSERHKAESELGTDDSAELITVYQDAISQGKTDLASAVMTRLAKNVDTNEILSALGYNTAIGLTKEEYAQLHKDSKFKEIEARKGLHDFLRDTLIKKGGMNEQEAFALESELAEIHKATQQAAYASAVSLEGGKFRQNTAAEQAYTAAIDLSKQDPETLGRKGTRFAFGGEGADGKFRVHAAGLNWITGNYGALDKQIELNRLSRWNGLKLTENENMNILREAAKTMGASQRAGYEKFLDRLENYGKKLKGGMGDFAKSVEKTGEAISKARSY